MKASNSLVTTGEKKQEFATYINSDKIKGAIVNRLGGDIAAASRLITTITSAVNSNDKLKECDYESIVSAALTGEVGMNLSLALGQYGIIPYGKTAKYQLQVNGLKQLCIRSKAYSKINCYDVREGEFVGRDPLTREPIFKWIEDEDQRLNLPIVGYYGFYMLNAENNNFFQCLYWSHEKILRHADRYAPAFSLEKYRALLAGELPPDEVQKLQGTKQKKGSSPWYANPDDDPHIKMCMKTVLKQLLNDGLAPKSIQDAIASDDALEAESTGENDQEQVYTVDADTGEVIDVTPADAEETPQETKEDKAATDAPEKPKRGRPQKKRLQELEMDDGEEEDEAIESFFAEAGAE